MVKRTTVIACLMMLCGLSCLAQTEADADSIFTISSDSILLKELAPLDTIPSSEDIRSVGLLTADTVVVASKVKRDWNTWTPNPQRALWLALVIPGGGQIYNRKFWKLPILGTLVKYLNFVN